MLWDFGLVMVPRSLLDKNSKIGVTCFFCLSFRHWKLWLRTVSASHLVIFLLCDGQSRLQRLVSDVIFYYHYFSLNGKSGEHHDDVSSHCNDWFKLLIFLSLLVIEKIGWDHGDISSQLGSYKNPKIKNGKLYHTRM